MKIHLVCEEDRPNFRIHSAHSSDILANKKKVELEEEVINVFARGCCTNWGMEMGEAMNLARKAIAGMFFVMPLELDAE